jgi:UDP-N-acetylglucosamine 2-epimerase (non-hydrolysing)
MKIAPLMHEFKNYPSIEPYLVHTGQHYDEKMSDLFFRQLNIPEPNINLEVGSASHAVQAARIIERFERVCLEQKPDLVMVVGDVNSTAACTFVAAKLHIKTCHYEAGLRSGDRNMPEEINRLVTDSITDLFFTTSADADENLSKEGVPKEKIHMVGNLMIDSLVKYLKLSKKIKLNLKTLDDKSIETGKDLYKGKFGIMTFHRPSNVDEDTALEKLVNIWCETSKIIPLIFPIHPRTLKNIKKFQLYEKIMQCPNIYVTGPIGYLEFINLLKNAAFAITDSGGIQEEATYLNIPCLTVRPNTERPITIWEGSNKLIKVDEIEGEVNEILDGNGKSGSIPKFWDGKSSNRIAQIILKNIT